MFYGDFQMSKPGLSKAAPLFLVLTLILGLIGGGEATAKPSQNWPASLTGSRKFGVDQFMYDKVPQENWGEDGETFAAQGRLWLYRDRYVGKSGRPEYQFFDNIYDKNAKDGVGLMDVVIIGRNFGPSYKWGEPAGFGVPIYKVRLYPFTGKTRKALQDWPAVNGAYLYSRDETFYLQIPVVLPADRTPNAEGYIETDWIACPRCFAMTMDGEKKTNEKYDDEKQAVAAEFGDLPLSAGLNVQILNWGTRTHEPYWTSEDYLVGPEAVAWAVRVGQEMQNKKERLAGAPKLYAELIDDYNSFAPAGALAHACPNRFEQDYSLSRAHSIDELQDEIGDIEDDYKDLSACFNDFFAGYDSSEWLETMPDFIAWEAELAAQAEMPESGRFRIGEEAEQGRINKYLDQAESDANGYINWRTGKAREWQRQIDRSASEAQMWASVQKSMRATADKFSRDMAQAQYEMSVRRNEMAMMANPGARSVVTLLPGATLDVDKLNARLARDRARRERMEQHRRMMEAETAAAAAASGDRGGPHPGGGGGPHGSSASHGGAMAASADVEMADDSYNEEMDAGDELKNAAVERPEDVSEPEPEPAPPEPIYVYSAVTADYETEGLGMSKENLIYDMEGEVILTDNFYRSPVFCQVDYGTVLIVEWTWLKGGSPSFGDNYFSTPDAARDDWWRRKGETTILNRISDTRNELEEMSMVNGDCAEITGGFTTY